MITFIKMIEVKIMSVVKQLTDAWAYSRLTPLEKAALRKYGTYANVRKSIISKKNLNKRSK